MIRDYLGVTVEDFIIEKVQATIKIADKFKGGNCLAPSFVHSDGSSWMGTSDKQAGYLDKIYGFRRILP